MAPATNFRSASPGDGPRSLVELLRGRALACPAAPAFTFLVDGERPGAELTWGELDRRAREIAARLQDLGLAGERALLLHPPGLEFVAAFFGCLYAGVVAVPTYPPRPNRKEARLAAVAADARPRGVLTTSAIAGRSRALAGAAPELATALWLATDGPAEPGRADAWREPALAGDSIAFLQYTSGSTASPKGVVVSHGNLLANQEMIRRAFGQSTASVILGWLPLYHDMGLIGNVLQPLYVGARCILMSPMAFLQRPLRWLEAVARHGATTSGGPDFAYDLCVRAARKSGDEGWRGLDLSRWSVAFNGAEPVRAETLERFAATFAPCGFRREAFRPCYGLAEATLLVTAAAPGAGPVVAMVRSAALERHVAVAESSPGDGNGVRRLTSSGRPWAGPDGVEPRLAIVDPETRRPVPAGRVGEVWVAGPSVASGYWNRPEETDGTFRAALAGEPGGAFLRTGDLGFLDGGELFVTGRLKDLVILRGRNHYPQDLERTVESSHPALRPGGGVAFAVEADGEERLVVACELERRLEAAADPEEVARAVRRAVAGEHEVQVYEVVLLEPGAVPRTSSGKVQRGACRAGYLAGRLAAVGRSRLQVAGAGDGSAPQVASAGALLALPPEARAAALADFLRDRVARAARLDPANPAVIAPGVPLASLGLDSLAAVELQHALEAELEVAVPLGALLESAGLTSLAAAVLRRLEGADGDLPLPGPGAPGTPVDTEPLASHGQRALWLLDRLAPESGAYVIAGAARLHATGARPVDLPALGRALGELVARHAALRTTFAASADGDPVPRVHARLAPEVSVEEAMGASERDLEARLADAAWRPFDLERGPLLRALLLDRGAEPPLLLVAVHHVAADFWSMGILARELGALYGHGAAGLPPALGSTPADHARRERELLAGPRGEQLLAFWRDRLAGAPDLDLPADRPRPALPTSRGGAVPLALDASTTAALHRLARERNATLFTVLLAGFQAVLSRWSGQEDLVVGSPVAGRSTADLAGVVGYLVNPLALRADLAGDPPAVELLDRTRAAALAAFDHADLPFPLLAERLRPVRHPGRHPLFQAMLTFHRAQPGEEALTAFALGRAGARLRLGELELEPVRLPRRHVQLDLALTLAESDDGLAAALEWSADLFDEATAERLAGHVATLLGGLAADPGLRVSELPLLGEAERAQLLVEWNEPGLETPAPTGCLHELVAAQATATPDAVAVMRLEESVTYRELERRVSRLARHLASLGIGAESRIGVLVPRSPDLLVGLLGVLKAGGAYVPLDPSYPAERLGFMVEDAGMAAVVAAEELLPALPESVLERVPIVSPRVEVEWGAPLPAVSPRQLAYLIYTSGSTGRPKAVAIEHGSAAALVAWAHGALAPRETAAVLASTSISFDLSVFELFVPLARGGTVVLATDALELPSLPQAPWVTLVNTVPSALAELPSLPESVLVVGLAGEPLPRRLAARIHSERFQGRGVRLLNLYGPSESTTYSTWAEIAAGDGRAPSIGRPIAGTRAYLLERGGQPVPVGVPGELCLGGAGLARGYLGRPELTAERFVPDPFGAEPGSRLYRTGDLARHRTDGELEFLGRVDHQVKVRGFRVELGEVEAALLAVPGVREAVVVARGAVLVAYVAPATSISGEGLRSSLLSRLPGHMVPGVFVGLAALPRTPNGKVDRRALPEPDLGGTAGYVAPRTAAEEVLAAIWAEVLEVERVGVHASFLELGGHSLAAMRVAARVGRAFGVELPVRRLFEQPTVAALAAALEHGPVRTAPPLRRLPCFRDLPLSFAQERLWFLDRLAPGSSLYVMPGAFRACGRLAVPALAAALGEVVRRHEALRTRFAALGGRAVQLIDPPSAGAAPLPLVDLRAVPPTRREAEAVRLAAAEARRPFDLERGPLLRTRLLRLGPEEHAVLLSTHHIVSDGWSMGLLARELGALYAAFAAGRPSPLPELPVQYADVARWQRDWLAGDALAAQLAFWRERLAGAPTLLELPADRPRPATPSFRGGERAFTLGAETAAGLSALARRSAATPFMVLLAALEALCHRWTGREDLLVGTPVANRRLVEAEGLIGLFVNTLVLRADLAGEPTFAELIERAREATLAASAHQDLPFERLVEELAPERGASHSPLVQVVLALQDEAPPLPELPGLVLEPIPVPSETAKFDLTLSLAARAGGLAGAIEHSLDLFDAATVDRFAGHFVTLLEGALADPGRRLPELPLLSAAERRQLAAWNETATFPASLCLHELFEGWALRSPDAVATVCDGEHLTYGELRTRAAHLAQHLERLGVGPEVPVGLCLERSLDMVVAILGVLAAGGAYVPLDPAYPEERLAFTLADARLPVVLTHRLVDAALPPSKAHVLDMGSLLPDGEGGRWAGVSPERRLAGRRPHTKTPLGGHSSPPEGEEGRGGLEPDHLAYVIYTSGSTGRPKGTPITHRNVARLLAATDSWFRFDDRDVWTLFHSYAFDFSVWELWGALAHGGRLVMVPYWVSRSPEAFLRLLADEGVTVLNQTPSAFRQLVRAEVEDGAPAAPSLRLVIFGGEALDVSALVPWIGRHGDERPRLVNMYGITETTVHVTWRPVAAADLAVPSRSPIGVPIPDLSVHLLDRWGREVPVGVPGEMYVGGAGLGRGYLGRPDLTAERFLPDPFAAEAGVRLYRTGDLARRRPDGEIDSLGRVDHQVKIRGFRIEPGEVEAALVAHPAVAAAVVVVAEDGAGERRLVAWVVGEDPADPADGGSLPAALRGFLRERLPSYMVPAVIARLAALPLTPSGKVDRRALAARAPMLDAARPAESASSSTPAAELLAGIWEELLGIERSGPGDDFFDLGGHSLLAVRLVTRVREVLGVELPLREVFEAPTLAAQVARVESALRGGLAPGASPAAPRIAPVPRDRPLPLSFAQQRLWLLDRLEPGSPAYNVPLAARLAGRLDPAALGWSLGEVVARHEALRTRFVEVDGEPVQVIAAPAEGTAPALLPVVDCGGLPARARETELSRLVAAEAGRPFDLERGPVLRGRLVRLGGDEWLLLLTIHHVACDGWSMGVLIRELGALYEAAVAGAPSPLPELPVQYADYAVWQRERLRGEALEASLAYWRERLAALAPLDLPADRPRPSTARLSAGRAPVALSPDRWRDLSALARRSGATPFMVLVAGWAALLARRAGRSDVAVGSPIANRSRGEIEGLIGFFVNTLVLRADLVGDPPASELLARVREVALGAYVHQDMPFERLVEELRPERDLARHPLVEVLIALQNAPFPAPSLGGLALSPLDPEPPAAKLDLTLSLAEQEEGVAGWLEYAADLFDRTSAQRLVEHFATLLAAMAADPGLRVSELPLLGEAERAQLLVEWNEPGLETPAPTGCLHELVAAQALATPDAVAVVRLDESVTYRELERRASRLARHLASLGIGAESRIGVLVPRSPDLLVGLLGVLKAGGAYVPLDPAYPAERLGFMVEDAGMAAVVAAEELLPALPESVRERVPIVSPRVDVGSGAPLPAVSPRQLAYLIYTSGSTGRPKAVAIEHGSAAVLVAWAHGALAPRETAAVLASTSISFDLSVFELFVPLARGGTVVLATDALELPSLPQAPWVTLVNTVPSALAELASLPEPVLVVGLAGEPLPRRLAARIHSERFQGRGVRLLNLYGPSESTTYSTWAEIAAGDGRAPSIGRPIAGTRAYLLERGGQPVPVGVPGELYLGGAGLARGYLGRPELTAERFVPDPFGAEPGSRLYRTGDLARHRTDGELEFLGRVDHQVKVRGFRVELGEVEAALLAVPGVREAVVAARGAALVAYVAPATSINGEGLRSSLLSRLPSHMVPGIFVGLAALPRTPNGKVDRRALPEPDLGGTAGYVAPRTAAEEALAAIWSGLLGIERIGVDASFLELGGHSLLAARLISRVRRDLGVDLPLAAVFETPTLAALARRLDEARGAADEEPPVPLPRPSDLPLSFAQERLWLLDRLEPGAAYTMAAALRLTGDLDRFALARSLGEVARRHEVLRVTVREHDGVPRLAVAPPADAVPLPLLDLAGLPAAAREREAERLRTAEAAAPFDLAAGPLVRVRLLRLAAAGHELLVSFHHVVTDGWSIGVFSREVAALYEAFVAGHPSPLPEPPLQYADFAAWQRGRAAGPALAARLESWRARLAGELPAVQLLPDRVRRPGVAGRAERRSRTLPPEVAARLAALGRGAGASPFMVLAAGLAVLLGRHGGHRDLALGTPVAGRTRPEVEGLIGCFLNTLALRVDLSGDPSFRTLLTRVRGVVLAALADQDAPFERVLEEVRPGREAGRTPLFQVLLNMLNFPRVEARLPGLALELVAGPEPPPRFDLTVYADESADVLRLDWVWDAALFDAARMADAQDQLLGLLEQVAADPETPIESLSLLTPRAAALLPDPAAPLPAGWHGTVHGRFVEQARRRPDAVALLEARTGAAWTYGELAAASGRLARALAAAGVRPGEVVAVWSDRSAALVVALLGTLRAGAAFVILDPAYPAVRLAEVARAARPSGVLVARSAGAVPEELARCFDELAPRCRLALPGMPDDPLFVPIPATAPDVEVGPDDLAYLAFTSGSTGRPKGIAGSHRPLSHFLDWHGRTFGLAASDRFSMLSGLAHDPLLRDVLTPLWLGATLAIPDPERLAAPGWLAGWMAREAITVAHLTPAMARLLALGEAAPLPALRRAFFGGDALTRRDAALLAALAPAVSLASFYGATETPQAMGWHEVPRAWIEAADEGGATAPLGRGIDGVELLVLDAAGRRAGIGETGEIAIRTPYLALGYLDDPALTRERFVPNPFAAVPLPGDRLYRTGDLGCHLPDGGVRFLGRADRQVKVRGFRVEPAEIEAALARHSGVRQAAVVARPDGAGGHRLVAYVVADDPAATRDLRDALDRELPSYMVPAAFVPLPALPLTPNGKLDVAALPEPGPVGGAAEDAPRDAVEAVMAEIWAGVLGVDQVGMHDDFFDLGGHSLLATQVIARVRQALGVELPLSDLFEHPTTAGLARLAAAARSGAADRPAPPPIRPLPRRLGEELPLSFAQRRLWFLDQLEPGNPNLHLPAALRLTGDLAAAALAWALSEIVRRHEVLRTTFGVREGRPFQRVAAEPAVGLPVADLAALPATARAAESLRLAAAEAWRPFDLARGPLLRTLLLRLAPREHALALTLHHIASDGWSAGVLQEELTTLYAAFREGRPSPLPELPVQYADFAAWQLAWLSGDALAGQLEAWRRYLDPRGDLGDLRGGPPALALPTDRPRPAVAAFHGARRPVVLGRDLVAGLRAAGRGRGATVFMVLMAAFQALLHRYTGQRELLVGTPVANRTRVEVERLIGMFFNLLTFRADLTGDPPVAALLDRVREDALAAYLNQDLPFERLLEELQPERHLSRTPLFQVTLVLQNAPRAAVELPGLSVAPLEIDSRSANFDLNLQLAETPDGAVGWLEYRTDLFDATTAERLARHFAALLAGVAGGVDLPVSRLPLLAPAERFQLVHEWNDTRAPEPPGVTMHGLFEAQARRAPEAPAVLFSGRGLTYGELDRRARRLADHLRSLGVGPGVPVAVFMERSLEMVEALLGILGAGGFYVPLDPAYPETRLRAILGSLAVPHVVTRSTRLADLTRLGPVLAGATCLDEATVPPVGGLRVWTAADLDTVPAAGDPLPAGDPDALAYVIFTSGSTGEPKGVMVRHRPVVNLIRWVNDTFGVGPGDRMLFVTSLSFDLSVYDVFGILAAGGTVRIATESEVHDPQELARVLAAEPVTFWDSAPAALAQVAPFLPPVRGGRLRLAFLSGDWIPLGLPGEVRRAFPAARVIALGGATEATIWSNYHAVEEISPYWLSIPYGRPIPNARYLVLDDHLEPCPIGVPGDLWIGGGCLSDGYFEDPALTADKYLPDPHAGEPGARLYRTGDRARCRADGSLEFLGRADLQVKVRGFRVEPGEIEAVLREHPGLRDAVVVAREDPPDAAAVRLGARAEKRLVAYVVPGPWHQGLEEGAEAQGERVARWQVVYDETYGRDSVQVDPTFDVSGWNSSYTGEPIPEAEMREWVERTVARVLGLRPEPGRVLEIGCGTGLLLFRIAPRCRRYRGTDISEVSLHRLERQLAGMDLLNVDLEQRAADDWRGIEPGSFDAVILNSVAQHFPSADYLLRVLEGAVRAVAPGGFVFVGDVRSLPLLPAFHASVQLSQASDGTTREQLARRVRQRVRQEEELVLDPGFFTALGAHLPRIGRVEVQQKGGRHRNEMTRFRYDAVLHLRSEGEEPGAAVAAPRRDWCASGLSLPALREALAWDRPAALAVSGVPDDRLREEAALLGWLAGSEPHETVSELRAALASPPPGIDPEDLWALGRELGYAVEVRATGEVGRSSATFRRVDVEPETVAWEDASAPLDWAELANDPLAGAVARKLVPRLRTYLAERLPEYMVPAAIVPLDALPLTANGKVDRRALPAPDGARPDLEEDMVAPRSAAERQLAAIWSEVLGIERIGVNDNFFNLGGDSILSIQVVARAQQAGLSLTPRQVFRHQTIAELAAVASAAEAPAEPSPVAGPLPLTPIQRWFFEQELPDPHHWNLAVLLAPAVPVAPALLDRAAAHLVAHHGALRLRFARGPQGWEQHEAPPDGSSPAATIDLEALPPARWRAAFESAAAAVQASLDLARGPLLRIALVRLGPGEGDRLLLAIHHLAVDGVSFRILLADLAALLAQLGRGEEMRLPPRTTSYGRWALLLAERASSPELESEAPLWLEQARGAAPLPVDAPGAALGILDGAGPNVEASARRVRTTLDAEDTRALLQEVPEAYRARIQEVLLAALAQALARWTGGRSLLVDVEAHGREEVAPGIDLSRTVGWFTSIHPLALDLEAARRGPAAAVAAVKEGLRRIPAGGIGYGLLRYGGSEVARRLERLPQAQVIFNYLGQFDTLAAESPLLRQGTEPFGATRSGRAPRRHLLEVYATVVGGRLELDVEYSANRHREATLERLAGWLVESLERLVAGGRDTESAVPGSLAPSDFPEAELTQDDLDTLFAQLG